MSSQSETPFLSDEVKMDEIPKEIEKALDLAQKVLDDYEKLLGYQNKIPFLPNMT